MVWLKITLTLGEELGRCTQASLKNGIGQDIEVREQMIIFATYLFQDTD